MEEGRSGARAREAEERAFEIEERRRRAEVAARKEAELREIAELQARQLVERFTGNLPQTPPRGGGRGRQIRRPLRRDRGSPACHSVSDHLRADSICVGVLKARSPAFRRKHSIIMERVCG